MKISEIRDAYYAASGKVSELVRQLALAGIAIIWLFRAGGENSGGIHFSHFLIWPLIFFVSSLTADFLQYVYFSLIWSVMNWLQWNRHHDNNFDVPVQSFWNWIGDACFWIKAILMIVGYGCLLSFLWGQI